MRGERVYEETERDSFVGCGGHSGRSCDSGNFLSGGCQGGGASPRALPLCGSHGDCVFGRVFGRSVCIFAGGGEGGFAGSCLWIVFRLLCRWCLVDAAGGFFHTGWGCQVGCDFFGRVYWRDLGGEPQEKGEILTVILKKHTWVSVCVFLYTQNVVE